jgi:hypothetical protein
MAVVVIEHQRPNTQAGRSARRRCQCRKRRKLIAEVIGGEMIANEKGAVAPFFNPPHMSDPRLRRGSLLIDHTKTESVLVCHHHTPQRYA